MSYGSSSTPLFGDVLARARQAWVREMTSRLAASGFDDYRISDALALRWLIHGALPFATFTAALGVSRQTARKVVDGLVERSFATIHSDRADARRRIVELTPKGHSYARTVIDALHDLNVELGEKIDHGQLDAALSVLTFVKDNFGV
jgi:DNA-binding MarR family transcriptional regulator